jgi:radical SAM superfamily enzyme YgiQ (UPF0313 family)
MSRPHTTIGFVQMCDVVWERRPSRRFHLVDGALRLKPAPANTQPASLAYLPHVAGLLQAYLAAYADDAAALEFLTPVYRRVPVAQAADHLAAADVVAFSAYVWNVRLSQAIAQEVKRRRPEVLTVMGGPQVPDRPEAFLRANPWLDVVCHGEGEQTFLEVLARRETRDWTGVESTSFLDSDGALVANPRRIRMKDLDEIPSPMLCGAYDALMAAHPEQQWLVTWETNRGCPFKCAFCDWGSATGAKVARYGEERLFAEIDWLVDHEIEHLFVCDANFGMLKRDVEIARRLAETYASRNRPIAVSVQNTKNRTDRSEEIQRVFRRSRVVSFGASISLQSVDEAVLAAIRRDNISLEAFDRLQRHYAAEGLDTYTDLIIGLPGESYASFTRGVDSVIRNGQFNRVAFYECFVLPNAPMAQPEYLREFAIETVPIRMAQSHMPLDRAGDEVADTIDMVVATSTLTREDWVRARVFAHLAELLFYDRLLHVPMLLLGSGHDVSYRLMLEAFANAAPAAYPVTAEVVAALERHARAMLRGGAQYVPSTEWLGIWWPADQHAIIALAHGGVLDAFYAEAAAILAGCADVDPTLVEDAVRVNQAAFTVPFTLLDEVVETSYPVLADYEALLGGGAPSLAPRPSACVVECGRTIWMSWEDWCEDLVQRVHLRKRYLHPVRTIEVSDATLAAAEALAT